MNWKYEKGRIYSVDENAELMAEATFVFTDNAEVDIDHTYVSPALRGKGVAGKMMEVVAEYLKENKLTAKATCPYANAWLKKHSASPADIISKNIDDDATPCKMDRQH